MVVLLCKTGRECQLSRMLLGGDGATLCPAGESRPFEPQSKAGKGGGGGVARGEREGQLQRDGWASWVFRSTRRGFRE